VQLTELFAALKGLDIFENRQADENLIDIVFETKNTQAWVARLDTLLGAALKPAGEHANGTARAVAKDFGGVRPEQTMYYKEFAQHGLVAMFWPWQNGRCTTCKAFCVAKPAAKGKKPFWTAWFEPK
jgi:hypothetical protein